MNGGGGSEFIVLGQLTSVNNSHNAFLLLLSVSHADAEQPPKHAVF